MDLQLIHEPVEPLDADRLTADLLAAEPRLADVTEALPPTEHLPEALRDRLALAERNRLLEWDDAGDTVTISFPLRGPVRRITIDCSGEAEWSEELATICQLCHDQLVDAASGQPWPPVLPAWSEREPS